MEKISRRQVIGYGGAALAGMLIGGKTAFSSETETAQTWAYHKLDPVKTRELGYAGFYTGRCCWSAVNAVVGQLAQMHGAPYNAFPVDLFAYGKSGVAGFGTLCGALNGGAALIGLFVGTPNKKDPSSKDRDKLITELFTWYEKTSLPVFRPTTEQAAAVKGMDVDLPATCADSVLCHRSVGVWCEKSGFTASSKERSDRCARITADVIEKVVMLLNDYSDGVLPKAILSAEATECLSCHGKGNEVDNAKAKMNCVVCHTDNLKTMAEGHGE